MEKLEVHDNLVNFAFPVESRTPRSCKGLRGQSSGSTKTPTIWDVQHATTITVAKTRGK